MNTYGRTYLCSNIFCHYFFKLEWYDTHQSIASAHGFKEYVDVVDFNVNIEMRLDIIRFWRVSKESNIDGFELVFTLKFIHYNVIDFLMIFTITVLVCVQNRFRYSYTSTFLPYIIIEIYEKWMINDKMADVAMATWLYGYMATWGGMMVWGADVLSSKFISNKFEK